ncbi:MAG: hypothetical protein GC136_09980 [Alphaproteobacteria bacterium]|nr:hypothetical protein [Alphaproteobacteria bacterium]
MKNRSTLLAAGMAAALLAGCQAAETTGDSQQSTGTTVEDVFVVAAQFGVNAMNPGTKNMIEQGRLALISMICASDEALEDDPVCQASAARQNNSPVPP